MAQYIRGNTVKKLNPEPGRRGLYQGKVIRSPRYQEAVERNRRLAEREMNHRAQQERLRSKHALTNRTMVVGMLAASVCALFLCLSYIQLHAEINSEIAAVRADSEELERLRSENEARQNSIDKAMDVNEIYRIATSELGMVYPDKDRTITYDKSESEYVRQYDTIPQQ